MHNNRKKKTFKMTSHYGLLLKKSQTGNGDDEIIGKYYFIYICVFHLEGRQRAPFFDTAKKNTFLFDLKVH